MSPDNGSFLLKLAVIMIHNIKEFFPPLFFKTATVATVNEHNTL